LDIDCGSRCRPAPGAATLFDIVKKFNRFRQRSPLPAQAGDGRVRLHQKQEITGAEQEKNRWETGDETCFS
jgi:hypothetical protein